MHEFFLFFFSNAWSWEQNKLKSKEIELFNHYNKTLKRNSSHAEEHSFHVATESFLRANDSRNAVLNNNQVLYNNPTSFVETHSSEKEITNVDEEQESGSNDSQSETLQIFENLNSTENIS